MAACYSVRCFAGLIISASKARFSCVVRVPSAPPGASPGKAHTWCTIKLLCWSCNQWIGPPLAYLQYWSSIAHYHCFPRSGITLPINILGTIWIRLPMASFSHRCRPSAHAVPLGRTGVPNVSWASGIPVGITRNHADRLSPCHPVGRMDRHFRYLLLASFPQLNPLRSLHCPPES